jgi:hypothetical protein
MWAAIPFKAINSAILLFLLTDALAPRLPTTFTSLAVKLWLVDIIPICQEETCLNNWFSNQVGQPQNYFNKFNVDI